ncbi:hypothetical protein HanXRQr2_Chr04g0168171 [Helianthus annuus]|uniref:Uncharacterized protein n=1 Tax=Helianthus annuus TaxID=4232 RepID=A0A9K3NRN8_HELAN|nr:hypothetical protein HanXRQr2_Chr04g0168171 [Helianthus annuus]
MGCIIPSTSLINSNIDAYSFVARISHFPANRRALIPLVTELVLQPTCGS